MRAVIKLENERDCKALGVPAGTSEISAKVTAVIIRTEVVQLELEGAQVHSPSAYVELELKEFSRREVWAPPLLDIKQTT